MSGLYRLYALQYSHCPRRVVLGRHCHRGWYRKDSSPERTPASRCKGTSGLVNAEIDSFKSAYS